MDLARNTCSICVYRVSCFTSKSERCLQDTVSPYYLVQLGEKLGLPRWPIWHQRVHPSQKKNMLLMIIPVSIPVNGSVIGMGPPIEKSHVKKGHLFGRGSYNSMGTITITIVIKHWTIHREPILQVHPSIISGLPFLAVQLLGRKWSVDGWDSRPSIEFSGNFRRITSRELKV